MMRTCVVSARAAAFIAAGLLAAPLPLYGQAGEPAGEAAFDSSYFAWQRGDFSDALSRLHRLLSGPDAHRWLEPAAVLTGELFVTRELTTDGLVPTWSPDGQYVSWESGSAADRRSHVARVDGAEVQIVGTMNGHGAAFDGSGSVYYITVPETRELATARAAVDAAAQSGSREDLFRARTRVSQLEAAGARLMRRELASDRESAVDLGGIVPQAAVFRRGETALYVLGAPADAGDTNHVYQVSDGAARPITTADGPKRDPVFLAGDRLLYVIDRQNFAIRDLASGQEQTYRGTQVARSADSRTVVFVSSEGQENVITLIRPDGSATAVVRRAEPLANPALSPDGSRLVFQMMPREDWELYVLDLDGDEPARLTREIQHDLLPQFIDNGRVFAVMGEARHRRSYLYDVATGERTRLFHNNMVRTVAPEYEWVLSPDRARVLIVAERDGNTVSVERGVYLMDLTQRVTVDEVRARVQQQLAAEQALREKARGLFTGIAEDVAAAVGDVSKDRIYQYERDLFDFDSKHITQPGNAKAIEYIAQKLREFGYEPQLQWFEARGVRTANIIARLPGTVQPDVLYTVSSHFDSVERGPGADDDTSGTAALLEAARVLSARPQPATIHFAFFTGEEAGLLGSREYVRRAVANGDQLVGALNNDMIGYANDQRLDNTIRYSNAGIRDIQHGAALLFTDLITYDAEYYKSTDAHAYYEAYGDIVGGIGSYPILGNPHYHQTHDHLETINHQLVAEVSKTTIATLMKLASSPSRVRNLRAVRSGNAVDVAWDALPERDIEGYMVWWGPAGEEPRGSRRVTAASVRLSGVRPGDQIRVSGINAAGVPSWDAARVAVQ